MPHQMLLPAKGLTATLLLATERPQSNVGFKMLHQVFLPLERLRADVTRREANPSGRTGRSGRGTCARA